MSERCRVSRKGGFAPRPQRRRRHGSFRAASACPRGLCVCVCGSYVSRALNGADLARLGGSEAPRRLASSWATMSRGRAPKRERARSRPASLPHCPCVMWYPWRRSFAEALARCCRRFRRGAPMRTASGTPSHEVSARERGLFPGQPELAALPAPLEIDARRARPGPPRRCCAMSNLEMRAAGANPLLPPLLPRMVRRRSGP